MLARALTRNVAQLRAAGASHAAKSTAVSAGAPHEMMQWFTPVSGRPGEFNVSEVAKADKTESEIDAHNLALSLHQESFAERKTFLEAIGLDSWWRKGPVLAAASLTACSREWYVINEETFVAGCLTGFGWMTYVLAREPFLNWYYDGAGELLDAQNAAEDRHANAARTFIEMASKTGGIEKDVKAAFAERAALISAEAMAKAQKEKVAVKVDFERKLAQMVNQKQGEEAEKYDALVEEAAAFAMKEAGSAGFKKDALAWAIAGLKDPKSQGKDPVLAVYEKFMAGRK